MDLQTYLTLDAVGMAECIQKKETTTEELAALSFEQLTLVNPKLNAFVRTRLEQVLSESKVRGNGMLYGVPIALKNISQAVKGEPLDAGAKLLKTNIAKRDSHFVTVLRNAGVTVIGHTNTPEFGLKNISEPELYGPTRNPWNMEHSPGGSSGGAAAAVASGIVPVAGASDGGGSIRIPASFTGLFGLKPTRGRTPVGPGVGRQWQGAAIDFALSRSVRDSAVMLDILQTVQPEAAFQTPLFSEGYQQSLDAEPGRPLTVAYAVDSPVGTPVSAEAKEAVRKTVSWFERQGHRVEEADNGIDGVQLMRDYYVMNSGEMALLARQLEQMLGRPLAASDVEIETWLLSEAGKQVSAADYSASLAAWDKAAEKMAHLHRTYDFYITPATAFTAPKVGELTHSAKAKDQLLEQLAKANSVQAQQQLIYDMFLPSLTYTPYTQLANLTGQPAMSVPVYLSAEGLPLGVQVMAGKGEEHRLLQLAYKMEQSDLWVGMKGNPFL